MHLLSALPVTDPVLIFALAMLVFVSAPLLFERFRVPGVIGLIVAGAVVGPNALYLLERGATVVLLGTVGLLYLMFMIGLELDLHDFNRYRARSLVFGSLSFAIPQAIGTGFGALFGYDIWSSLLLGSVFASHTVLAYPVARRLGIVRNLAVTTTLGGTILTEILALLVLAVASGGASGSIDPTFWVSLFGLLALYMVAIAWGVPLVARWFFRRVRSEPTTDFAFVMTVLFGVSYLAHAAHVEPIIGALLVGLALNRLIPDTGPLMNRINFVGGAIFIPFFLLSVGMLVDARALVTVDAWIFAGGLTLGVIVAKWIAAKVTERVFGYTSDEGWVVFGLSVPHASGTLAIVLVGFGQGLFDRSEVNGVVLTILVTCLIGPWVVERYGRKVAQSEERKPYEPRDAPQRILIPISNPATEESLLDLAMALRDPSSSEPLYPLMVVREDAGGPEASVAEAEKWLTHAVIYAAGAQVPVAPLTRVDQNIAAGIARGVAETRSSTVVVGWDGGRATATTAVFGGVLDHLLESTKQTVIVARLAHPLAITKRLVLLIPPLAHHHPGFYAAARACKVIAGRLGASLAGLLVSDDAERYDELFGAIKPSVAATFQRVPGWGDVIGALRGQVRDDDLVVVLSARRGTISWHPKLERLPSQLAGLAPGSFLVIFPPEADTPRRDDSPLAALPRGLSPERMVFDLPGTTFDRAIRTILETALKDGDARRLDGIVATLVEGEKGFSSEVRPGVFVPHARVSGIEEPILFMGTSSEGILFPQGREPAKLIFILLSPAHQPQEHLRSLAEIAGLVSREGALNEVIGAGAAAWKRTNAGGADD